MFRKDYSLSNFLKMLLKLLNHNEILLSLNKLSKIKWFSNMVVQHICRKTNKYK